VTPSIVLFSFVDHLLANPNPPAFLRAARTLEQLAAENIALVLCSHRTRAELECIRDRLGIFDPFICERGAAVMIPTGYFESDLPNTRKLAGYEAVEFGRPYPEVVDTLHRTAGRMKVRVVGFADMSIEEVASECHMPLLQARLAKLRDYDELFRVTDGHPAARRRLFAALQGAALHCTEGHPFDTVGAPVDHGIGVNLLTNCYRRALGEVRTVGVTVASGQDDIVGLVDHSVTIPEVELTAWSSDILRWAEAIVGAAQHLLQRDGGVSTLAT
jgi:mannosyl-3-phosphoglycerate phosphatase